MESIEATACAFVKNCFAVLLCFALYEVVMVLSLFSRRTFVWRYCFIVSFAIYVVSMSAFIQLLSPTLKTRLDFADPTAVAEVAISTRSHSPAVSSSVDGRRPLDAGDTAVFTKPTKEPTAPEVLRENTTLHEVNTSDLMQWLQFVPTWLTSTHTHTDTD